MLDPKLQERLNPKASTSIARALLYGAIIVVCGFVMGWLARATVFATNDLQYALSRAAGLAAECKSVPQSNIMIDAERRVGKPRGLFEDRDYLIAIDYIFDRIEARNCVVKNND